MWKKIILAVLIAILVLICIGILWIMSLDSIVDKDGMIYEENNKNAIIDEGLDIFISKLQEKVESNEYLNKLK